MRQFFLEMERNNQEVNKTFENNNRPETSENVIRLRAHSDAYFKPAFAPFSQASTQSREKMRALNLQPKRII